MKPNWLGRDLVTLPYYYTLCTTPEMFQRVQARLGVLPHRRATKFGGGGNGGQGARVTIFEQSDLAHPEAKPSAICTIDGAYFVANYEGPQIAALLVHEAAHIWQAGIEDMGETAPSDEFMAYGIQRISQALMYEFTDQMGLTK